MRENSVWLKSLLPLTFFGLVPVFIQKTQANPFAIGIFRLCGACFLFFILSKRKKELLSFLRTQTKLSLLLAVFFSIHWYTYFWAIKNSSASFGLLGLSTYGLQLIAISYLIKRKRPTLDLIVSALLIVVGLLFIAWPIQTSNPNLMGLLIGTLSATFYALIPNVHQKNQQYPHEDRVFGQFIGTALFFLFFWGEANWGDLNYLDLIYLIGLTTLGTWFAHSKWIEFTTQNPGWVSGVLYYQVIPITLLANFLINGESHSATKIFGAILLICANLIPILKKELLKRL